MNNSRQQRLNLVRSRAMANTPLPGEPLLVALYDENLERLGQPSAEF
jgi:hypothetical protein